ANLTERGEQVPGYSLEGGRCCLPRAGNPISRSSAVRLLYLRVGTLPFPPESTLSNQFEQALEERSDFQRQLPPTTDAANFLSYAPTFGVFKGRGSAAPPPGVPPRAAPPVAQLPRGTSPGPQFHQGVRPQAQVKRRYVGPIVSYLLLARTMHLF